MNIIQILFRELKNSFFGLKILKFFDADPDPGSEIRNLFDPGSEIHDGKIQISNN